jgi:hypothetical protein
MSQVNASGEVSRFEGEWSANAGRIDKMLADIVLHQEAGGTVRATPDHCPVGTHITDLYSLLQLRGSDTCSMNRTQGCPRHSCGTQQQT